MKKMTPEELEAFIHQTLRSLPARPAPRSLELRVMAALEHQALIPWYHQSWSYWPAAVRGAFLAVATGVTGTLVTAFFLMSRGVDTAALTAEAGNRLGLLTRLYGAGTWTVDFVSRIVSNAPPLWFYGSLAVVAALYATFFGLGAAAYRTLYRRN